MNRTHVIAIDGFAATGKSTIAKKLARTLDYRYLDTGSMFRTLTHHAMQQGFLSEEKLDDTAFQVFLENSHFHWLGNALGFNGQALGNEIRSHEVAEKVSHIAAIPFVRAFTLKNQHKLASGLSIVIDGRDIGTEVFPEAHHKFFLNAAPEVRAHRRWEELREQGQRVDLQDVLQNVRDRDKKDSDRIVAPLRKANDAVLIDTSEMSIEAVFQTMLSHIQ